MEYNVNKYTDEELIEILDLSNPTDRELEARIIQLIRKYSTIHNESGRLLREFFEDVYNRFFNEEEDEDEEDQEDDEDEEDQEDDEDNKYNKEPYENMQSDVKTGQAIDAGQKGQAVNAGQAAGQVVDAPKKSQIKVQALVAQSTTGQKGQTTEAKAPETVGQQGEKQNMIVNQLDYTKDKLNPILKQTVNRVVSIDSQYRDPKYPLSTEFTFNLSEPLRDVVSLKLYSIQIPVTWYTISNNFGGNFFILKGNAPGILDNAAFEYKVEIASGNYTAENLAKAVNDAMQALKTSYTDISFGTTNFTYNPINSLATMQVDIQNVFNENRYVWNFSDWSSPIATDSSGNQLRYTGNTTLPAYLGFNSQSYLLNEIRSERSLPLIENSATEDTNNAVYALNDTNNYFEIIQYQGPAEYTLSTPILNTIRIQLDLSGVYSRNAIVSEIDTKLKSNIYLENSGIKRTNISDVNVANFGNSYYTITVNLNKSNTLSNRSLKTAVIFPQESDLNVRVWTKVGASSTAICALSYRELYNEFSSVIAETDTLQTNYIVKSNPYIVYKCIANGYTNPYPTGNYSTITDICFNDYKITLPSSPETGWSFSEYLQVINNAYLTTNANTVVAGNPNGSFNMTNMGIFNDTVESKIYFRNDLNKIFLKDNYIMDLSGSDLFTLLGIGASVSGNGANIDLSINNVLTSVKPALPSYFISPSCEYIAVIYPKSNYSTNTNAAPWRIPPVPELRQGKNLQDFVSYVNTSFQSFQDASGSNPLSETSLAASANTLDNTVSFTLTTRITKTLTENDYQIQFYDLSSSSGTINFASNYWDFTSNSGLVSTPKTGIVSMTGTSDASYSTFTQTGNGFSATNKDAPSGGITYGFIGSNYVLSVAGDWTLNMWYYSTLATSGSNQVLASQYHPTLGGLQFAISNNTLALTINGNTVVSASLTSQMQLDIPNAWHMFSATRSGNTYAIYYDGNLLNSVLSGNAYTLPQSPLTHFSLGIYGGARGYWDDVAIWPNALSANQVKDVYSPYIWQNSVNNSWFNNLKIGDQSYNLVDYKTQNTSYSDIYGIDVISGYTYTITQDTSFVLLGTVAGILDASSSIIVNIPASPTPYTRQQLFNIVNDAFAANPHTVGSYLGIESYGGKDYVKFRANINQIYTANDYRVVFYDPFSFVKCYAGIKSVRNASWDSTLGWILGFRETTEYVLSDYTTINTTNNTNTNNNIISIVGDTAVTTNLYNYFLIVLDDYTQSHLNDGLVTVTQQENDIALPSYANRTKITCDSNGDPVFNDPTLTQNQIYAANQIIQAKQNRKRYTSNPAIQDVFALIPMKTGGLANGSSYIEFGGTLQNQARTYFGPVNIQRMTIKLMNDRGDVVDLNGSNWSFSLICEQLYQQKSL